MSFNAVLCLYNILVPLHSQAGIISPAVPHANLCQFFQLTCSPPLAVPPCSVQLSTHDGHTTSTKRLTSRLPSLFRFSYNRFLWLPVHCYPLLSTAVARAIASQCQPLPSHSLLQHQLTPARSLKGLYSLPFPRS